MKNVADQHTRKITHGVCTFTPEPGATFEDTVRTADEMSAWADQHVPAKVKKLRLRKKLIGPWAFVIISIVMHAPERRLRIGWESGPKLMWNETYFQLVVMRR